ncbi:hypothetical protein niasHT_031960 [Heterodera trifolii]|uniref:RING-type domain-containing protein n=1 Tax=Heterodera trifolii TaxID=157864 RepID=A0ABD2HXZ1_9BILA
MLLLKHQFFVDGTKTGKSVEAKKRGETLGQLMAKEGKDKAENLQAEEKQKKKNLGDLIVKEKQKMKNSGDLKSEEKQKKKNSRDLTAEEKHETLADLLAKERRKEKENPEKTKGKLGELLKMEEIKDDEFDQLLLDLKETEQISLAVFSKPKTAVGEFKGMLARAFSKRKSVKEKKNDDRMGLGEKYERFMSIKANDPALSQVIEKLHSMSVLNKSGKFLEGSLKKYLKFIIKFWAKRHQIPEEKLLTNDKMSGKRALAIIIKIYIDEKRNKKQKSDQQWSKSKWQRFLQLFLKVVEDENGTNGNLALEFDNKKMKKKRRGKRFAGIVFIAVLLILLAFAFSAIFHKLKRQIGKCFGSQQPNANGQNIWAQNGEGWTSGEEQIIRDILPAFMSIKEQKASQFMTGSESAQCAELAPCAICLEEIGADELVRPLPCQHIFHTDCISDWFYNHFTCPNCRAKFNAINGKLIESAIETTEVSPVN